jgi:hypothetical protein
MTATARTIERMLRPLLCTVLLTSVVMGTTLEDSCRERGFDPYQLSCDSCKLLNTAPEAVCRECCQSYKTLHGQPQRYKYAVLVYGMRGDEIKSFVEESVAEIHSVKGPGRLEVVPHQLMMPSTLYWFDSVPPKEGSSFDSTIRAYKSMAKEYVHVEGWRKDDLKDMLLTLLSSG